MKCGIKRTRLCGREIFTTMKKIKEKKFNADKAVSRLVLPAFEDCKEVIINLTEEAYQLLLKQPDERKVITMSVLIKFYSELKKISQAHEDSFYGDEAEDDRDLYDEDYYEEQRERDIEQKLSECECGAYQLSKKGELIKVADCCC